MESQVDGLAHLPRELEESNHVESLALLLPVEELVEAMVVVVQSRCPVERIEDRIGHPVDVPTELP